MDNIIWLINVSGKTHPTWWNFRKKNAIQMYGISKVHPLQYNLKYSMKYKLSDVGAIKSTLHNINNTVPMTSITQQYHMWTVSINEYVWCFFCQHHV